jgi:hypothetical protein
VKGGLRKVDPTLLLDSLVLMAMDGKKDDDWVRDIKWRKEDLPLWPGGWPISFRRLPPRNERGATPELDK